MRKLKAISRIPAIPEPETCKAAGHDLWAAVVVAEPGYGCNSCGTFGQISHSRFLRLFGMTFADAKKLKR